MTEHPLLDYDGDIHDYVTNSEDDVFLLFAELASEQIQITEEDGEPLSYLLESIECQLKKILKLYEPDEESLIDFLEIANPYIIDILLTIFYKQDSELLPILIELILDLDETQDHIYDEFNCTINHLGYDDVIFETIILHDNWRYSIDYIRNMVELNPNLLELLNEEIRDEISK